MRRRRSVVTDATAGNSTHVTGCEKGMQRKFNSSHISLMTASRSGISSPCIDGFAYDRANQKNYPCQGVDLASFVPLAELQSTNGQVGEGNDVWGWSYGKREFAIVGVWFGTSFVEVTDPTKPIVLGFLPSTRRGSIRWHDIKVNRGQFSELMLNNISNLPSLAQPHNFSHPLHLHTGAIADHAYIVSEQVNHGLQIFNLRQLLTVAAPPILFKRRSYTLSRGFSTAHNVVINSETDTLYAVGTNKCFGGLYIMDISIPDDPQYINCYGSTEDDYVHDAQCVIYRGPDASYYGEELCFCFNENSVDIVNVDDKTSPYRISQTKNDQMWRYVHQGWLTEDQRYLLVDDEQDEEALEGSVTNTTTYVMDVTNLKLPSISGYHAASTKATDHNQYVSGGYTFQANYDAGLRILEISDPQDASLIERAYFDVEPEKDTFEMNGAWSVFPFLPSGNVLVSTIEEGLFVLKPTALTDWPPSSTDGQLYANDHCRTNVGRNMQLFAPNSMKLITPPAIPQGSLGCYVESLSIGKRRRLRMGSESVNIDVSRESVVEVSAMVGLGQEFDEQLKFRTLVTFGSGKVISGSPIYLFADAHDRYEEYTTNIKIPEGERTITNLSYKVWKKRKSRKRSRNQLLVDSVVVKSADEPRQGRIEPATTSNIFAN